MTPKRIWSRFQKDFPGVVPTVTKWYSHRNSAGGSSIKLVLNTNRAMIYTIYKNGRTELRSA